MRITSVEVGGKKSFRKIWIILSDIHGLLKYDHLLVRNAYTDRLGFVLLHLTGIENINAKSGPRLHTTQS